MVNAIVKKIRLSRIGQKMMVIFTLLLAVVVIMLCIFSITTYINMSKRLSHTYLGDITYQTTNNLKSEIESIESIHMQILASPVVQEQLRFTNRNDMTEYMIRNVDLLIEKEFATTVLLNDHIRSANIVAKSGVDFSIANLEGAAVECAFSEEEIYEANGTTLWTVEEDGTDIVTVKAILDLKTMMPLGYINIVFKQEYFADIVQNNSTEFSCCTYALDENGTIVSSNVSELLGKAFPYNPDEIRNDLSYVYDSLNDEYVFYYVGEEMQNGWTLIQSVSVSELYKDIYKNVRWTLLFLATSLAVGFILIKFATGYITRPARQLVESMKLFGEGNLSHRVEIQTMDEIGQIGVEYNQMAANIETLIEKVYKMEILQKQAEIDFLCMQINPHFLYNTLDTISWMAIGEQNMEISEMTIALADLLRAMVKSERFVTIEEELQTVRDYLFIQEQRFGDRINVKYEIDAGVYQCQIPNFILQPLIENAIIHGLEPKIQKGNLLLAVSEKDGFVVFRVEDDGIGLSEEEIRALYEACESDDTKQSIGLKNVYRRLILCYGEQSRLSIQSEEKQGTKIEFHIPMQYSGF